LFFGSIGLGTLAATFWAGHAVSEKYYESKIASIEAKHDRAISEMQGKINEGAAPQWRLRLGEVGEENVPLLSKAVKSGLSMEEFANLPAQANSALFQPPTRLTSLQQPRYVNEYANKAYKWSGYVTDVRQEGSNDEPEYCVEMRLDPDEHNGFSVRCVFEGGGLDEMMKELARDQRITVRGVRAESGRLLHCVLVGSAAPPQTASAN
jgi:hypothetical protein